MNKLSRLVIVGASGHGKVIADIAKLNGYDDIVFLDDDEAVTECAGYPVVGSSCDFTKVEKDVVIAIGNAKIRSRIQCQTAHCGRCKPRFVLGEFTSPIVPYRNLPQTPGGMTADCRSLV